MNKRKTPDETHDGLGFSTAVLLSAVNANAADTIKSARSMR